MRHRDQNLTDAMNERQNGVERAKMKNIRGSQAVGGSKNRKQKEKIAMQKLRLESIKPMKLRHEQIEEQKGKRRGWNTVQMMRK